MKRKDLQYLTDAQRERYTKFLTVHDCQKIAAKTGYSLSGVNNILYQRTALSEENKIVVTALDKLCNRRMSNMLKYIGKAMEDAKIKNS